MRNPCNTFLIVLFCQCLQLAFDSEGIAITSVMGFVKNPVRLARHHGLSALAAAQQQQQWQQQDSCSMCQWPCSSNTTLAAGSRQSAMAAWTPLAAPVECVSTVATVWLPRNTSNV